MYVSPAPSVRHQDIVFNIAHLLQAHCRATGRGGVSGAPIGVLLSEGDIVQPDLLVILPERMAIRSKGDAIRGAPNLVVEVLSRTTRKGDRGSKRHAYDRFGVDEYWIVDPEDGRVEVHTRAKAKLEVIRDVGRSESFVSRVMAGLLIAGDEILG